MGQLRCLAHTCHLTVDKHWIKTRVHHHPEDHEHFVEISVYGNDPDYPCFVEMDQINLDEHFDEFQLELEDLECC